MNTRVGHLRQAAEASREAASSPAQKNPPVVLGAKLICAVRRAPLTVRELARRTGDAEWRVRHACEQLAVAGMLTVIRVSTRRGRPVLQYYAVEETSP